MAVPEARDTALQSVVAPSLKVTVPVGVPLVPPTVAVNVTESPVFDGFIEDTTPIVAVARPTLCVEVPVAVLYVALPEYEAFSVCEPLESDDVVHDALPEARVTAEHSVVVPSRNVTVPVGVAPDPVTFAVIVTLCPGVEGFGAEPRLRPAASLFTDCVTVADFAPYVVLPEYAAVIVWLPAASELVVQVALPAARATAEQSVVAPSLKVTVPVGAPLAPLTDAANVTDCPTFDGFTEEVTPTVAVAVPTLCVAVPDAVL